MPRQTRRLDKSHRLSILLILVMVLGLAAVRSVTPAHSVPTPRLSIYPSHLPLASPGSTVTFSVNVSNISPSEPLAGWDIYVTTDNTILTPTAITLCNNATCNAPFSDRGGTNFMPPGLEGQCINGLQVVADIANCGGFDGPGVAHDSFSSTGSTIGSLLLFNVTFKAVAGPYTLVGFSTSTLFDPSALAISFTPIEGDYGNVPTLALASFTWTPLNPFEGERVTFNATSSSAPPGHVIVDYLWTFVALTTSNAGGRITSQVFSAGTWIVILVVKDDRGISSRPVSHPINVRLRIIHDLAITLNFPPPPDTSTFLQGRIVNITAIVQNVGTAPEFRFNVSIFVAGELFRPPPYAAILDPGHFADFTFAWATANVQPGTYTVHAHVDPVPGETETANNDAYSTVIIAPFEVRTSTDLLSPLEPTRPDQEKLTVPWTITSGASFTGTATLSASSFGPLEGSPSSLGLNLRFDRTTLSLKPGTVASSTLTILLDDGSPPGTYTVTVVVASSSFSTYTYFDMIAPSDGVRMPQLTWTRNLNLTATGGVQIFVATIVNPLQTNRTVDLIISGNWLCCGVTVDSGYRFLPAGGQIVIKLNATLDVHSLQTNYSFVARLYFFGSAGQLYLSSDVRSGKFRISTLPASG